MAVGQDPAGDKAAGRERTADTVETIKTCIWRRRPSGSSLALIAGVELHLNVHAKPLHACRWIRYRGAMWPTLDHLGDRNRPGIGKQGAVIIGRDVQLGDEGGQGRNQSGGLHQQGKRKTARPCSADHELAKVWNTLPEGDFGTIVKLLTLTGLRRDEIGSLRWSEIDMRRGTITLPPQRVKNNRQHIIPMSEPVLAIIKAVKKTPGRDFVFGYGDGGFADGAAAKNGSMRP